MHQNRIQKLLFKEYSELAEMVLVESPFAETDENGNGIRQVYLGVTPTQLIIAGDQLKPSTEAAVAFPRNMSPDPEIENFELLSVCAIESANLTIFKRKRRRTIKAQLCNEQTRYFELGGFENRAVMWNLWCERLKFLNAGDITASPSSASSLLLPLVKSITSLSSWRKRTDHARGDKLNYYSIVPTELGKIACNYSFI
ncbi:unnamed protein product [Bemisia tabaci]|uniref:Uncharacterized protein n=1 Tax=Bemisia tabaci TaxID=7038 RepID=A0A9P0C9H9_BEMTA|nr:unnamed protein product [Bemisia tabaci]